MMKRNGQKQAVTFTLLLAMTCSLVSGALTSTTEAQAAKKAALKTKHATVKIGEKKTIKITGKRKKAVYSFKASNKKIKVSKKGVITGVKAGNAKVTVKEKYKKKTKKLGVVSVQVKAKQTPAAASSTPNATQPAVPSASPTASPSPTPGNSFPPGPTNEATPAPPTEAPTNTPESTPFTVSDKMYAKMKEDAVLSTGNNARIKSVISRAKEGEDITLAYIGGSITEGALATPNDKCYAAVSAKAFGETYGKDGGSNVHYINAGVSGTPSSLGIIRYDNDILDKMETGKTPDILFIEFAVNDFKECTNGGAYEGLIRRGLASGSAVILVFSTFKSTAGGRVMESSYIPYGEHYDLPMISMGDSIEKHFKTKGFYKWYFGDDLHPNNTGHQLMADCIMNLIDKIDKEDAEADNIDCANLPQAKNTDAFTGTKCINASTDISTLSSIKAFDKGDFTETDKTTPVSQVDNNPFFPNNWMHSATSGNTGITATVNCKNLLIVYKLSSDKQTGTADLYVDGEKVTSLSGYDTSGWNNATTQLVFQEETAAEHKIEIKMAPGSENKTFTVLALGYNE